MPANFISAKRMQGLTKIASRIIRKNINKTRNKQFSYTYDDFEISGTPNNFQVKVTTKEKVNLEWMDIKGNLKYNIVYKCTIDGLPPVMKQAWQNVEFDGQSLSQNKSTIQDYIYNSVNTISTFGEFDWDDITFNESVAFNNFKVAVEGSPSVKIGSFQIEVPTITGIPAQQIGFDVNIGVPSSPLSKKDCKDTSDGQDIDFGALYERPRRITSDGVGFRFIPKYDSLTISDLTLGAAFPAIIGSLDSIDGEINKDWNSYVVKPLKNNGFSTPKLKLPTNGSLMTLTASAVQTTLNELLDGLDLSKEIDPILRLAWNKEEYNRKSKRFIGKNLTCDEVTQGYNNYQEIIENIYEMDNCKPGECDPLEVNFYQSTVECIKNNRGNPKAALDCIEAAAVTLVDETIDTLG